MLPPEVVSTVRNRHELANGLFTFFIDPPESVRGTFHTPGQYHRLSVSGVGESYFALASAPSANAFEYLARAGSTVADALVNGARVEVSSVMGPGFPLPLAKGHELVMVATGTGIAPIRSVIETLLPARAQFGRVQLLYGARAEVELAFSSQFDAWRAAGIEVHVTLSTKHAGWSGEVGRVQQRLEALAAGDAFFFLCGQVEMEHEVSAMLQKMGHLPSRIFVNH